MAIVLKFSLCEFTVLPFGLYSAPSTFQKLINRVFSNIIDRYVLVYLDNILIYTKTAKNHKKNIYMKCFHDCKQIMDKDKTI